MYSVCSCRIQFSYPTVVVRLRRLAAWRGDAGRERLVWVCSLGGLAGNAGRLGTPDRHTFPPDGKPRAPRPVHGISAVSVAPTLRLRRSRARSPVPSPEHFAWMGTLFGRKDTQTMNQLLFWMKRRWWIGGGRAPGLREMTMAEGKPNFRVVERLKIKIGEWFLLFLRRHLWPSFSFCAVAGPCRRGRPWAPARTNGIPVNPVNPLFMQVVKSHEWPTVVIVETVMMIILFVRRWCEEFGQGALVTQRRTLHNHTWPGRNIPHSHYWKSNWVSTILPITYSFRRLIDLCSINCFYGRHALVIETAGTLGRIGFYWIHNDSLY